MEGPVSHRTIPTAQRANARRLRAGATDPETCLWQALRAGRFIGAKIRRQVPIGPHIVDFCCHAARLVIEVDGSGHASSEGMARDAERTRALADHGYRVLRFWNHEVLRETESVLDAIFTTLVESGVVSIGAATPLPVPPPQGGGERAGRRSSRSNGTSPRSEALVIEAASSPVPSPLVGEGQGEGSATSPPGTPFKSSATATPDVPSFSASQIGSVP